MEIIIKIILKYLFFFIYNPFVKGNVLFYNIINNFKRKMPKKSKATKHLKGDDIPIYFRCSTTELIGVRNLSPLKIEMSQMEFDTFIKEIEDFKCFKFTIFNNEIQRIINRIKELDINDINTSISLDSKMKFMVLYDILHDDDAIPYVFSKYTLNYIKRKVNNIKYVDVITNLFLFLIPIYFLFLYLK